MTRLQFWLLVILYSSFMLIITLLGITNVIAYYETYNFIG